MIKIFIGNVGSGKTLMAVHDMLEDDTPTFTNIATQGIKHSIRLEKEMLIKETPVGYKKNGEPILKREFNKEFWLEMKDRYPKINIILDEAHTLLNSRRSISTQNIILTDFLALIRKFLGSSNQHGHLTLISQLSGRLDVIARDMCTFVQFHVGHYVYGCDVCRCRYYSNSEQSICDICPRCGSNKVMKIKTIVEIWQFNNMDLYEEFRFTRNKTYFKRFKVMNPEKYFKKYDTMQWDNLFD